MNSENSYFGVSALHMLCNTLAYICFGFLVVLGIRVVGFESVIVEGLWACSGGHLVDSVNEHLNKNPSLKCT